MAGFFGVTATDDTRCATDVFFGTDYHSHLGTRRAGMAVRNSHGFHRAIHNIENSYFRTKFESELVRFHGNQGIGVIMISSELPEIIGMCDRVLVMHEGRLAGEFSRGDATEEAVMMAATGTEVELEDS